jgi:hypothetical protein
VVSLRRTLYGPAVRDTRLGLVLCTLQLVYMGDLEFGGYRHEITGGNDGGYNAPFDINGDGQEIDNWAKVKWRVGRVFRLAPAAAA